MSQKCYEEGIFNPSLVDELEILKKSINDTLSAYNEDENGPEKILLKHILDQILQLQKEFHSLETKLTETQTEIRYTETEEIYLKEQMGNIEKNINKFVMETQEREFKGCSCLVF